MSAFSVVTKLPPGGWRLLNRIYDTATTGTQYTVSAATLIKRCRVDVGDLVEMSSFGRGLVYAVNRRGDALTMSLDAAMAEDLKRLYLHLTPRGVDWVTGTPENVILRAAAEGGRMWLGLKDVLKLPAVDGGGPGVVRGMVDAGLIRVVHAGGSDREVQRLGPVVFSFPSDFTVRLTPRGREIVS